MPGDNRINQLLEHAEGMITILQEIQQDMQTRHALYSARPEPDPELLRSLKDSAGRAAALEMAIEDDLIGRLIGLNNLLGPLQYLVDRQQD
jgi:hypothetical protein